MCCIEMVGSGMGWDGMVWDGWDLGAGRHIWRIGSFMNKNKNKEIWLFVDF